MKTLWMKIKRSDAARRAARTFAQATVGAIALQAGALTLDATDGVIDVNLWGRVGITAAVAGVIALVSWAQNALEDKTGAQLLPK